ncbi:AAA family ATPase [Ancylobacter pratisalsi]|uniref:AAA family ATPase n=1 Tax=Ancylobacter pratisalsi TaxID=1745854 RepID=A0A6P1YPW6_9HYPH|nr:AAA family ATPase [Ancylobacter pratisalsi]QIB34781.1 AAA family ATPase [Ancylobacter pratisalsi]
MLDKTKEDTGPSHDALRDEVRALMEREGLTQRHVAEESGIAYGTLTPYMGGTYQGNLARVAGDLQRWLETRRERSRTAAVLPAEPDFVLTPTAEEISGTLSFAQAAQDFAVIVGGAGIGKTRSIKHYAKRASNVWVLTAEDSMKKPSSLLSVLAEDLDVSERRNAFLSRAISSRLRGTGGLVVVDEAQHLSTEAFDQLRTTVLDVGECGVVAAGNESMLARLQGSADKRAQGFAQLHSRVGMRKVQSGAKIKDVCLILAAWGITDAQSIALLKAIARKPGALRVMAKVIRLASMLAGASAADITKAHVERAWAQLSSQQIDA